MKKALLILAVALSPASALAHGTVYELAADAVAAATAMFDTLGKDVTGGFTSVKAWPEDDVIKVKFSLQGNTSKVYSCHEHHDSSDPAHDGHVMCEALN